MKGLFRFFKLIAINTVLIGFLAVFLTATSYTSSSKIRQKFYPSNYKNSLSQSQWDFLFADSLLKTMTLEEKVGQLFIVAAFSNRDEKYYQKLESQIQKYNLGGLIFFQGNPITQAQLTNRFQLASKNPLLIGIDAEWGLGMRLDGAFSFPKALTMGATGDTKLVEQCAEEMAKHCKRIGVHINFAPDADVNTNPQNPVINYRSFGESSSKVSDFSKAFAKGLRKYRILSSAKHFPGHGNTKEDSHYTLPTILSSKEEILNTELIPFKELIKDSISSIMVGHLSAPAFDPRPNMPASISEPIIKGLLKGHLLYEGLVISDALNMRGITRQYPTGLAECMAFKAGNDILLQTENIDIAYPALLQKFLDSTFQEFDLNYSVRKIILAKKWAGLYSNTPKTIEISNISQDLNTSYASYLKQDVFNKAVTIVKHTDKVIPIENNPDQKIICLTVAKEENQDFLDALNTYGKVDHIRVGNKDSYQKIIKLKEELSLYSTIIIGLHPSSQSDRRDFGLSNETIRALKDLSADLPIVLCVFGNPYSLRMFSGFDNIICGYEDEVEAYKSVADILHGVRSSKGKLPITTLNEEVQAQTGIHIQSSTDVLGMASPYEVGMDGSKLATIKSIINGSIQAQEFPGAQVLIAKDGKIIYNEAYGNMKYGELSPISTKHIYDLASLTKVSATLQAVMQLYDRKKLDINHTLSKYIPEVQGTDKANITIRDLLLHQAGLQAFLPFWMNTKKGRGGFDPNYYIQPTESSITHKVGENLYIKSIIKDSVLKWIIKSPKKESGKHHVYSDLGMILLQHVIEKVSGLGLDEYCQRNFYEPLQMTHTGFNIHKSNPLDLITPTEKDNEFRESQIHGTVHDPNAALLGGVAGHAGLFSNAWDLAKLFQMNLNGGTYNNKVYFSKTTSEFFSRNKSDISHRILGWNKPQNDGNVSQFASPQAYGHTGYTGTVVWIDPKYNLVFIFLTNRVYPNNSNLFLKNKTRKRVHDIVYQSLSKL
ncbi:MAG: glycoside hydrolase family 3 N-terminal domain-containing protein [Leadbetterella sp.]